MSHDPAPLPPGAPLTRDAFLGGRVLAWQPVRGYRAGTDAVLLAAAAPVRAGESVLDAGCGVGVAALCLLARVPGARVAGVEIQPQMAALARRNGGEALEVLEGDLLAPPEALRARGFDHVITNPPFHDRARGVPAPEPSRERAMGESVPLGEWLRAALARLRSGGRLTAVLPAERLGDALHALHERVGGPTILPVAAREGREASRAILLARKGGRAPTRLLAPLVMHQGPCHTGARDHGAQALALLQDAAPLRLPDP